MKMLLNIFVAIALFTPGMGWADDAAEQAEDVQIALVTVDPGLNLGSKEEEGAVQPEQQTALETEEAAAPGLKSILNDKNAPSPSKHASLYSSPKDVVNINPFFTEGLKGLALKVRW
ncbi:MAG: hypothetical protein A3C36_02480 [Omnitrophica WOR_2 bacterium RIFCSPHIGHO2_02_FULL_52_10]|nr:MAG: hypothetical protein A3C36_02480 [Omnitrophica WOR_2 bacterium RIFCSPHIGHO2_02_FULL_52_10]